MVWNRRIISVSKTAVDLAVRYDRLEAAAWLRDNGVQSMAGKFTEIFSQAEINQFIAANNAVLNAVLNNDDSEESFENTGACETHYTEAEVAILCEAIIFSK